MQCGDEQSPPPRSSARGDTGSLGGLAGAAPPAPSRTARHTETPLPTPPTRWEYPRERGSPFLPSAPRHRHVPSAPKPTAHPTPPLAPPQAHRRPLPTPAPNFPRHPKSPTKLPGMGPGDGTRGRDAGARPLLTGAGGCPVPPRRRRGERIPQRPPRRPPPAPRRPAPDGSGRPSGLYVGPGLANERGEGRRCQWRAGRWGCAALIYCPKLQWKHGRAAPLDTEPKYYGGTRWGMRRECGS